MKKSILVAAVLAFALTNAGPASAVRGKEKGAQSKGAVASERSVQSKTGAQSKAGTAQASKSTAASAKSSAAK